MSFTAFRVSAFDLDQRKGREAPGSCERKRKKCLPLDGDEKWDFSIQVCVCFLLRVVDL